MSKNNFENRMFACPCGCKSKWRKNVMAHQRNKKCGYSTDDIIKYDSSINVLRQNQVEENEIDEDIISNYNENTIFQEPGKQMTDSEIKVAQMELLAWQEQLQKREVGLRAYQRKLSAMNVTESKAGRIEAIFDAVESLKKIALPEQVINIVEYKVKPNMLELIAGDYHYSGKRDDDRVKRFLGAQIGYIKQHYKKGDMVRLSFLGDDIEGQLHLSSLDKHQEEITMKQLIGIASLYLQYIKEVINIVGEGNIEIVFVPESNHGQIRLLGMDRNQSPKNDVGYVIRWHLSTLLPNVKFYGENIDGTVETADSFYMHGDKDFMKSSEKVRSTLGKQKDIIMGHWHTYKATRHKHGRYLITAPKATDNHEFYAINAGYEDTPQAFIAVRRQNGLIKSTEVVDVE